MLVAAVAHHLDSLGLVTWRPDSAGGDCFIEHLPDQPDQAVALFTTGGRPQGARLAHDWPTFQIRARGTVADPLGPHARLQEIYSALQCLDNVTLAEGTDHETAVGGITGLQSDPVSIGRDAVERPECTQNYQALIHRPTAHRPPATL